jgi:carboxylesterase
MAASSAPRKVGGAPPEPLLVPGGEPFLLRGGPDGCLLVHGFTALPEEMRLLGDDLAQAGHTVLGIRPRGPRH